MNRMLAVITAIALTIPLIVRAAMVPSAEMKSATAFIVNYDDNGKFIGWGSGFFVDEGIVVTNKHVIDEGVTHEVYVTDLNFRVDLDCFQSVTKDDVRISLDDDVAYMRAFVECDHGVLDFADDPWRGDEIAVMGFPYKGSVQASLDLTITSGSVIGETEEGWLSTDAYLDIGNSGGPVVNNLGVVGVAVAKGIGAEGQFIEGYFVPASAIEGGLIYASQDGFGYTPRSRSSLSRTSMSSSVSSARSQSTSSRSSSRSSSRRSSSRSSLRNVFSDITRFDPGYVAILRLYERDIIDGYPDGTFRPAAEINRAEFLKILVGGFEKDEVGIETDCFSDVKEEWFAPYVCAAKRLGWVEGYPDGAFRPAQAINRAEAMKIVIDAFGRVSGRVPDMPSDVRQSAWYYSYIASGVRIGIVDPDEFFRPAKNLTREDAAIWIWEAED